MSDQWDHVEYVYGELLRRHMAAAREDFHGERRKKLYLLIEDFRVEWPEETARWEARFSPPNSPQGVHQHLTVQRPPGASSHDLAAS